MKQLKKMAFKEAVVLTDSEKKMVLGGNLEGDTCNVSTTCDDGTVLAIYSCKGMCSSLPGQFVECVGQSQTLTKSCGGNGNGVQ